MDTRLAISSRRDGRRYAPRALTPDATERILDAGRLAGSARNGQPWTFVVAESQAARRAAADAVYRPELVESAGLVVALAVERTGGMYDFDAGRAAQNMMLAAWNDGIASCPNGIADPAPLTGLGIGEDLRTVTIISFGYPPTPPDPSRKDAGRWSATARRRPLGEVVRRA